MEKYLNEAIIGNKNVLATFTRKGELQRLYFPGRSIRQYIDFSHVGVKINDSDLIYLHDDIKQNPPKRSKIIFNISLFFIFFPL